MPTSGTTRDAIGKGLRDELRELVTSPLPERLRRLLDKIDQAKGSLPTTPNETVASRPRERVVALLRDARLASVHPRRGLCRSPCAELHPRHDIIDRVGLMRSSNGADVAPSNK